MVDVAQSISTPPETTLLANGIAKLFQDIVTAKRAGATGTGLLTAAVTAAVADLEAGLVGIGAASAEISAEPLGVAEAFILAGIQTARALTGK